MIALRLGCHPTPCGALPQLLKPNFLNVFSAAFQPKAGSREESALMKQSQNDRLTDHAVVAGGVQLHATAVYEVVADEQQLASSTECSSSIHRDTPTRCYFFAGSNNQCPYLNHRDI
mgnify:CR=1 FL=1